jgi:hypothetical protein
MNNIGVVCNCSSERKGLLGGRIGCPRTYYAMNKFASSVAAAAVMAAGLGWAGLAAATEADAQPGPPIPWCPGQFWDPSWGTNWDWNACHGSWQAPPNIISGPTYVNPPPKIIIPLIRPVRDRADPADLACRRGGARVTSGIRVGAPTGTGEAATITGGDQGLTLIPIRTGDRDGARGDRRRPGSASRRLSSS